MIELRRINWIVIHCTATPADMFVDAELIRQWHLERNWKTIGYHQVILRNGLVQNGRPWALVGAHVLGHNEDSVGVALVGGVDEHNKPEDNFTAAQMDSLYYALQFSTRAYRRAKIVGHNFFEPSRGCPSFDWRGFVAQHFPDRLPETEHYHAG